MSKKVVKLKPAEKTHRLLVSSQKTAPQEFIGTEKECKSRRTILDVVCPGMMTSIKLL